MRTMQDIADALAAMKFRKKLLGGVDEADVQEWIDGLKRSRKDSAFITGHISPADH